ncbi:MAG: GNAT family N-acetyltransferase [Limnochordia bacterium]|jgi:GNAT superfamily N-acetyltransferase
MLADLLSDGSEWDVYVADLEDCVVGFVSLKLNPETGVGETGLNAVHPDYSGRGIGTGMYRFAPERVKEAGMKAAAVATGGDPSHSAARRAYEKAGFDIFIPSVWMCKRL